MLFWEKIPWKSIGCNRLWLQSWLPHVERLTAVKLSFNYQLSLFSGLNANVFLIFCYQRKPDKLRVKKLLKKVSFC